MPALLIAPAVPTPAAPPDAPAEAGEPIPDVGAAALPPVIPLLPPVEVLGLIWPASAVWRALAAPMPLCAWEFVPAEPLEELALLLWPDWPAREPGGLEALHAALSATTMPHAEATATFRVLVRLDIYVSPPSRARYPIVRKALL